MREALQPDSAAPSAAMRSLTANMHSQCAGPCTNVSSHTQPICWRDNDPECWGVLKQVHPTSTVSARPHTFCPTAQPAQTCCSARTTNALLGGTETGALGSTGASAYAAWFLLYKPVAALHLYHKCVARWQTQEPKWAAQEGALAYAAWSLLYKPVAALVPQMCCEVADPGAQMGSTGGSACLCSLVSIVQTCCSTYTTNVLRGPGAVGSAGTSAFAAQFLLYIPVAALAPQILYREADPERWAAQERARLEKRARAMEEMLKCAPVKAGVCSGGDASVSGHPSFACPVFMGLRFIESEQKRQRPFASEQGPLTISRGLPSAF
eukprot:1147309-Pelagomonas_calceolata.AAC.4